MTRLKQGDSGVEVARLQMLLNAELSPSPDLKADGGFGPKTHAAVVRFQQARGLPADGVVGRTTWEALGQRPAATPRLPETVDGDAPWLTIAQAELGIQENKQRGQHTARIVEYHQTCTLKATDDETPWCSSFVNWAVRMSGRQGTDNALASSWLRWGAPLDAPRPGAVTVIKKKGATSDASTGSTTGFHVGFFVSATPTHVRLLGGNQSDQVKFSSFPLSKYDVRAFRWPER